MNEYIQEKIKELLRLLDVRIVDTSANYKKMEEIYSEDLKNALQDMYNRGVEDSLACVPERLPEDEKGIFDSLSQERQTLHFMNKVYDRNSSHNTCRQQTIDNISKLLTNK